MNRNPQLKIALLCLAGAVLLGLSRLAGQAPPRPSPQQQVAGNACCPGIAPAVVIVTFAGADAVTRCHAGSFPLTWGTWTSGDSSIGGWGANVTTCGRAEQIVLWCDSASLTLWLVIRDPNNPDALFGVWQLFPADSGPNTYQKGPLRGNGGNSGVVGVAVNPAADHGIGSMSVTLR